MTSKVLAKTRQPKNQVTTPDQCVHHWIIDPPEGPVSQGVCKTCGDIRDFNNYVSHSIWDGEATKDTD